MSNDVLITPASRKIEFKDSSANVDAKIETDASGNLVITNTGGDISIGDTTSDIFVGDGTNNIDIVFEQDGEIRGTTGVTVTLGQSDSNIRMATDLNLNSNDITNVNDLTVTGNLTVNGTTTTLDSTNTVIEDSIIELNSGLTGANTKDIGFIFERGSTGNNAGFVWDESADRFTVFTTTDTAASDTVDTSSVANFQAGSFYGNGANLTSLNADNLGSGTVPSGRLGNALLKSGGTMSGSIAMANYNITGVNQLEINDPGEGIVFKQGSSGDMVLKIIDDASDNILQYSGTNAIFDVTGGIIFDTSLYFGATDSSQIAKDGANIRYMADGIHKFETYAGAWVQRAQIDDDGLDVTGAITATGDTTFSGDMNVGGTGNASIKVRHIEGKDSASANYGGLFLNYSSTSNVQIGHSGNLNDLFIFGALRTGNSLRLDNSGNLHNIGTVDATYFDSTSTEFTSTRPIKVYHEGGNAATAGGIFLKPHYSGTTSLSSFSSAYSSGDLLIGAGMAYKSGASGIVSTFANFSDERSGIRVKRGQIIFTGTTGAVQTTVGDTITVVDTFTHDTTNGNTTITGNTTISGDLNLSEYIYHTGDTNTYVRIQSDSFTFRTGGSDRLLINNSHLNTYRDIKIIKDNPVLILNETSSTSNTDQVAYISFQDNGTEEAWLGWGSNGNTNFTINNNIGSIVLNGNTSVNGTLTMGANTITGSNYNISGVNALTINDPGEGIIFTGTNNVSLYAVDDANDNIMKFDGAAKLLVSNNEVFHDAYHPNADKWTTARTLSLTGAVTGSVSWDGSGNASITTTATADPTLTLSGDASGSATFTNLGNATLSVSITNDSHTHNFSNLTGKTSGTGEYSTSSYLTAGRGSGGVSLTHNDGYGNANVTFNHKSGVPEQAGNCGRIVVNTDSTTGAKMTFELLSNSGTAAVNTPSAFELTETGAYFTQYLYHLADTDTYIRFTDNRVRIVAAGTTKFDSNNTYLTSFDITTQTDPKYLRSDTADTASGAITFSGGQTWNSDITWNNGKNIHVAGESSFDVTGSGLWQVWDSGSGAAFIKCDVGARTVIGDAGSRGLLVDGELEASSLDVNGNADISGTISSGNINIGAADTSQGTLTIHGGGTGNAEGGEIRLGLSADHDGTYDFYRIDTINDDFRIGRQGQTDLTIDQSGNITAAGNLTIGSDNAGDNFIRIGKVATGTAGLILTNGGNDKIKFLEDSDEHLRIYTNNTNLGLSILEAGAVECARQLKFTQTTSTFETPGITYHTNNYLYIRGGSSGLILSDDGGQNTVQISDSADYVKVETGDGSERVRINSSGLDIKSGGLLIAVDADSAEEFERIALENGLSLKPFGELTTKADTVVSVK